MSIWHPEILFSPSLPEPMRTTLGEGKTPCIDSKSIGPSLGLPRLAFKLEMVNPTGSYKDRFAALAISYMRARQEHTCLATSSGNTGASPAAYCAAAGIRCRIAVVETAPRAKLQQMMAYGAEIERVRGFGVDPGITRRVFERLEHQSGQPGCALQISAFRWSPLGMQGVQSIAWELGRQLEGQVDHVFCPAGGGGLTLAVARGFDQGGIKASVHCVQPQGNDTIAGPLRGGADLARDVDCTTTISGLQVANVIDGDQVIAACRRSGGTGHTVTDSEVFAAQRRLAREEGLFCEPAGAVALAGVIRAKQRQELDPQSRVICLITGSGFKDTASIETMNSDRTCRLVHADDLFTT